MIKAVSPTPKISIFKLLLARGTREELIREILEVLAVGLKRLDIVWNRKAFKAGLSNEELPSDLLKKLERFIEIGSKVDWNFLEPMRGEFDELIEDIETFSPTFREELKAKSEKGEIPLSKLKARLGLDK